LHGQFVFDSYSTLFLVSDIDLSVLTSFNRLKELSEDLAVIAGAVADSTVVQLSADNKKIRRAKPLPLTDDTPARTVYMVCIGCFTSSKAHPHETSRFCVAERLPRRHQT
jgi:hypothetical protein